MESRQEQGLYIFMHSQPAPDASSSSRSGPINWHDILWKQALEANPAVQIIRHDADCERVAGQQPLVTGAIAWSSWNHTIGLVSRFVRYHRQHSTDVVVKATGLLGDGDEESYAPTLLDTLRNLGSRD
jgi:hypothetical protein